MAERCNDLLGDPKRPHAGVDVGVEKIMYLHIYAGQLDSWSFESLFFPQDM